MSKQIETRFRNAAAALQRGDALKARQEFAKLTKKLPGSAPVWYNLGLSCQHLGKHDQAVSAYRKALARDADAVEAWVNLGLSYKHLDDAQSARDAAQRALALDARHARALNLMGSLEAERGNHQGALEYFNRCLQTQPGDRDASINLANLQLDMGNFEEAHRLAASMLTRLPDDRRLLVIQARVLIERGELEQADTLLKKIPDRQHDTEALRAETALREAAGDYPGVIEAAARLVALAPDDAAARRSLASACFQVNDIDRARDQYERAVALEAGNADCHGKLGVVYATLGQREAAERHYRRALELDPGNTEVYLHIAAMKRFESLSDPDIQAAEALWRHYDADRMRRIELAFALGKMYDDCGAVDRAFSSYRTGNELKFAESSIDLASYFRHLDHIASFFTEPPQARAELPDGPRPIFILGMPRSGTTLVERILSRHPDVRACGELPFLESAVLRLENAAPGRAYPDDFPAIGAEELTRQARDYLERAGRLHTLDRPFFTDKMPYNFVHVWLIKALFPGAAIIHCRRHPLDVILSNYFQLYGAEVSFTYDLTALAEYTVRYHRLMRRWQSLFPDGMVHVDYESLVDNAGQETARLVEAVGLPWDDACLEPSGSTAPVRTTSIWQVRRGIYTDSKARWRRYEGYLREAAERLIEAGILDGDSIQ